MNSPLSLSHQIRLALLSRRLPQIARLYDALSLHDITEGTYYDFCELGEKIQMGHHTIQKALKLELNTQAPLFLKRPASKKRGRPAALFIALTEKQLSSLLDVRPRDYYEMPSSSLTSNQLYRAAVYHFQISNNSGEYKRAQLAKMLGVTPRTAQKLDSIASVKAQPQYSLVTFDLAQLPTDARDLPGNYFLHISETGQRKPANLFNYHLATKKGHHCLLMKRILNWYEVDYSDLVEDFLPKISDGISLNTKDPEKIGKKSEPPN